MTQETAVIDFIKKHGGITSAQAMHHLHISRLAVVINRLRAKGVEVKDEILTAETPYGSCWYKRYSL